MRTGSIGVASVVALINAASAWTPSVAHAQPDDAPQAPGAPAPPSPGADAGDGADGDVGDDDAPAPSMPPPAARDDAAWQLYHQAFAALARDDRAGARAALADLHLHYPDHAATVRATLAIDAPPPARAAGHEVPDQASRAELALFQTFHGAVVGVELCIVAECDSGEAVVGLALLGGAGGAAVSLSTHPTPGQRALVNSGTAWGAFNAAMVLVATQPDEGAPIGATLLGGQAAGVALALGIARDAPTAGQVALANSGGQWTLALTGLSLVAADVDLDEREVATTLALAADAGIGLGAYLGWRNPRVSRAQTLVIDAAGIVGAVAGGAAGVMATGDADDRSTAGLAAVGAALGLGAAGYLTRHWGADDAGADGPPIATSILPVRGGGLVSAHLAW